MFLNPSTRLGPYEIIAPIGAGGMGEVYKARDTRLDRIVAIKVLPQQAARDPEFKQRFEREAKSISALDHPHICTLYDLGHENDITFLVMQYLEGETLAARLARSGKPKSNPSGAGASDPGSGESALTIARGPMPVAQVFRYATETALALDAAHRRGIVHRDLKPGNVMLTKTGVKLLDFGLAKITGEAPVSGFGESATRTTPLTAQGAILGTLQYMSPEQLEGSDVDARSDIFSFGAMLYEMLTGRLAFESQSQAGMIAAILQTDPPALAELADPRTTLPPATHRALDRLLKRCLAKDPDERWHSAADLAAELQWIDQERQRGGAEADAATASTTAALAPASRTRERIWMALAIIGALGAAGLFWWTRAEPATVARVVTFELPPPAGASYATVPGLLALSPDGAQLAFLAKARGATADTLWLRPLGSVTAHQIPGTEDAWQPSWSPNGRYVLFGHTNARLKRIDIQGGAPLLIADPASAPGAWSPAGVVVFTGDGRRLYRVSDLGGPATPLTDLDPARQETDHLGPVFLPDGRRFIYFARSTDEAKSAIYLASLDRPEARSHLVNAHSLAAFSSGYLLYVRAGTLSAGAGTLMAHPFDESRGTLTGDPVPIVEDIRYGGNGRVAFTVSATGALAYQTGASTGESVLMWFDFSGKRLGSVADQGRYRTLQISPDGRRLATQKLYGDRRRDDVWLIDLERGVGTRFTTDEGNDASPVWLPDGSRVIFGSSRSGIYQLYQRATAGAAADEILFESPEDKAPRSVAPDGKTLLFERQAGTNERRQNDIWALPLTGDRTPRAVVATPFDEASPVFSPDGRWIAFHSNVSGTREVYAQAFPTPGITTRISTSTGSFPQWTSDGKTIVYTTEDRVFMAVDVAVVNGELRAGASRRLFESPIRTARTFAFDPVSRRFLIPVAPDGDVARPVTVVLNWAAALKK